MKIFGIIIGALGLYIFISNYVSLGMSVYNKKHGIDRFVSPIPFAAGVMLFASAVILLPKSLWALGFLAFLLDHTYPMFVYAAIITRFFTRDPKEKK